MELRHLRYFTTLAETLHYGQAAERLHIVQPALSMQIKALEDELGVQLFTRNRRSVALTEAGRVFLEEARRSLHHAEQARQAARDAARGAAGRMRMGFSTGAVSSGVLRRLVRAIRAESSGLILDFTETHPMRASRALLEGELDMALGTFAAASLPEGIKARQMHSCPPVIALPEDHPLALATEIDPESVRGETFIGYADADDPDGMTLSAQVLGYLPRKTRRVGSPAMAAGLAAAGLGIAVIPETLARPEPGVTFRPLRGRPVPIEVSLLWREGDHRVRHLLDRISGALTAD